ncbi:MAG: hypothetical protein KJ077_08205 [Anaerolineae bacterium]|nr:hypothetical protein [Anaerolineae bacterium]
MKTRYVLLGLPLVLALMLYIWPSRAASWSFVTVPGYAFQPDLVFNDTSFSYASGGALVGWHGAVRYSCFYAPLTVPDGAIIKGLEARVLDQNPIANSIDDRVNVYLIRTDYTDPENKSPQGTYLIEARTLAFSNEVQHPYGTAIDSRPVDNLNYTYVLTACLNGDQRIWKVKIFFEEPLVSTFLPVIEDTH